MTFFLTSLFVWMVFWRPQEWLFRAMFGWPVLDVVVGITLISMAVEINEGRLRIPRELPQLSLLIGLWISAPLSHAAHTYLAGIMMSLMPVFTICFFSYLLIVILDRPERLRTMAWLFVVMGCTMAMHAILQMDPHYGRGYGFGHQPPMWVPAAGTEPEYYRAMFFGIFSDPNDLAQFLVTCMPLSFALTRRFNLFSLLLGVGVSWFLFRAMMLTDSRGGQLAFVAVIGTQILLWLPHRWFPYLMGIGLAIALVLCPFSGKVLDESAHDRVVFWGLANAGFLHSPVFGVGYEMAWTFTQKNQALHNAYVTCYAELGLVGYWCWYLLIVLGLMGAWRTRGALRGSDDPRAKWLRRLSGQTMVAMVGFGASAYFLSRTFVFPLFFLIAMLASMPRLARAYLPPHYPPLFNKRRDLYIVGTASVIVSIFYIYLSCRLLNMAYYG